MPEHNEPASALGEASCRTPPGGVAMKGEREWGKRIWNSSLDFAVEWLS
jgi:hypothetical protein